MPVKRLSTIIGKNIGGSLGWDGTQDAHWELGRKLGGKILKLGVGIGITKTGIGQMLLRTSRQWDNGDGDLCDNDDFSEQDAFAGSFYVKTGTGLEISDLLNTQDFSFDEKLSPKQNNQSSNQ